MEGLSLDRLTSGSGPSTYPADRDFKGHIGGGCNYQPECSFGSIFVGWRAHRGWCCEEGRGGRERNSVCLPDA